MLGKVGYYTAAKGLGGLGVGSLKHQNLSLLGKWWWRFKIDSEAIWVRIIKSIYGADGGLNYEGLRRWGGTSIWGGILAAGGDLERRGLGWVSSFKQRLGDGSSIKFWEDDWMGNCSFRERFPRLYYLESRKEARVCEKGSVGDGGWVWNWVWSRPLRGRALGDLEDLQLLLQNVSPFMNRRDTWSWNLDPDGVFSTKALHTKLIEADWGLAPSGDGTATQWNCLIPRKVCIFAWRAKQGSIPVRMALDNRGIDLNSVLCPWCNNEIESVDHCLAGCQLLQPVWNDIFKWWGWNCFTPCSAYELLRHQGHTSFNRSSCKAWEAVLWSACYLIWKNRNDKVFKKQGWDHQNMVMIIKSRCFDWLSRRCKRGSITWDEWIKDPAKATNHLLK